MTTYIRVSSIYSSEISAFAPGGTFPTITREGTPCDDGDVLGILASARNQGVYLDTSSTPFGPVTGPIDTSQFVTLDGSGKIPIGQIPDLSSLYPGVVGSVNGHTGTVNLVPADIAAALATALPIVLEVSGVYPARPTWPGPVAFVGPDTPSGGGTTTSGPGAVDGLDLYFKTAT